MVARTARLSSVTFGNLSSLISEMLACLYFCIFLLMLFVFFSLLFLPDMVDIDFYTTSSTRFLYYFFYYYYYYKWQDLGDASPEWRMGPFF